MKIVSKEDKKKRTYTSVIDSEEFRLEMKNGMTIKSANLSIDSPESEHAVAMCRGSVAGIGSRTAECLLNLATSLKMAGMDDVECICGIKAAADMAIHMFKEAVAEEGELEEGLGTGADVAKKFVINVGGDE